MKQECCGTCKHSRFDRELNDFACHNEESEYYGIETGYEEPACEEYEER